MCVFIICIPVYLFHKAHDLFFSQHNANVDHEFCCLQEAELGVKRYLRFESVGRTLRCYKTEGKSILKYHLMFLRSCLFYIHEFPAAFLSKTIILCLCTLARGVVKYMSFGYHITSMNHEYRRIIPNHTDILLPHLWERARCPVVKEKKNYTLTRHYAIQRTQRTFYPFSVFL